MRISCLLTCVLSLLLTTSSLVAQDRQCGGRETIRLFQGNAEEVTCGDAASGILEFRVSSFATPFVTAVTDTRNVIQVISKNNKVDFSQLGAGGYRVYGLFFKGNLLAEPGMVIDTARLSDYCYGLTRNFVPINTSEPEAGMVTDLNGLATHYICPDNEPDIVAFANTGSGGSYAYAITNTDNVILALPDSNNFDFNQLADSTMRVWGIAYAGPLNLMVGDTLSRNLADDRNCFDLSDNFLEVIAATPDGGQVQLTNGSDEVAVCAGAPGMLSFLVVNRAPTAFTFVLTDDQDVVQQVVDGAMLNHTDLLPGQYRIHGVSFTGNPSINPGDTLTSSSLSDDCFDQSDNFVELSVQTVDGGQVSLENGSRMTEVCVQDGESDQLVFVNNSTATEANYVYIITNENDEIILPLIGDRIDFDVDLATGVNRIYGLSYTGESLLEAGQNVQNALLSDACFDLSSTYVTIVKSRVFGGEITLADSTSSTVFCPEGKSDTLTMRTNGTSSSDQYAYLVTNTAGRLLTTATDSLVSLGLTPVDTVLIYGVAYSGDLRTDDVLNIFSDPISDGCFSLSQNAIEVTAQRPQNGEITLKSGSLDTLICPSTELAPFDIAVPQASGGNTLSILTDTLDTILTIQAGVSFTMPEDLDEGTYHLYAATYTGDLLLQPGQFLAEAMISDDCFALSNNAIALFWEAPQAGMLEFTDGTTQQLLCPQNGNPDTLRWTQNGSLNGIQTFLLTDTNDVVQSIIDNPVIDGDLLNEGIYRIYGLAWSGNLTVAPGDTATQATLSDNCFQLSDNFLTIQAVIPVGGTVTLSESNQVFCSGDGVPDILKFARTGATEATNYTFLVTNLDDVLLFDLGDSTSFDFEDVLGGNTKVYGLAYTGALTVVPGDTVTEASLSDDCFSLSENALTIERQEVDGGTVTTQDGRTEAFVCAGDGNPDLLRFVNNGLSQGSDYLYIVTTNTNLVVATLSADSLDFESTGFAELRVWGVSYAGNLTDNISGNINDVVFSDACFELSDNFVRIVRDLPEGGRISTTDGETNLVFCPGADGDTLRLFRTSTSTSGFRYLLADADSTILRIQSTDDLIMTDLPVGDYLIFGLSFTGQLLVSEGDTLSISSPFSDNCFDLADSPITLRKGGEVDGGRLETLFGDTTFYTCPGDTLGDAVAVLTPPPSPLADYRLIITDDSNRVEFPDVESPVIDFNRADPGIYRIYGVSYTGTFFPQFEENLFTGMISSECFEPSENFIHVINFQPSNSLVSISGGLTEVSVDGIADTLNLEQQGAVGELPYRYLLTDTENQVIAVLPGSSLLADTLATGSYRIWGLNYTGALLALPGTQADADPLADNCFVLSDNFISLTVGGAGAPVSPAGQELRAIQTDLHLQPNPAIDQVNLRFSVGEEMNTDQVMVRVIDRTGAILLQREIGVTRGFNQMELNLNTFPNGMYLVQIVSGQVLQQGRLIKVKN